MHIAPGKVAYVAGTATTEKIPAGAKLLQIIAFGAGGATVSIFGGAAIPVPVSGPLVIRFVHDMWQSDNDDARPTSQDVVFTSTTGYFVEYVGGAR